MGFGWKPDAARQSESNSKTWRRLGGVMQAGAPGHKLGQFTQQSGLFSATGQGLETEALLILLAAITESIAGQAQQAGRRALLVPGSG